MEPSAFLDRSRPPGDGDVTAVVGETAPLWRELADRVAGLGPSPGAEWAWSGRKLGWALRLRHGKRPVLYLTPCRGFFRASLALGEKAVAAAREAKLPAALLREVEGAPKFPEGRAVRIEVHAAKDLPGLVKLARIRLAS